jgi:hypothetical protein
MIRQQLKLLSRFGACKSVSALGLFPQTATQAFNDLCEVGGSGGLG